MNAKKCDACGKLYEHYGKNFKEHNSIDSYHISARGLEGEHVDYDLCPECMKKVLAILKGGRE